MTKTELAQKATNPPKMTAPAYVWPEQWPARGETSDERRAAAGAPCAHRGMGSKTNGTAVGGSPPLASRHLESHACTYWSPKYQLLN